MKTVHLHIKQVSIYSKGLLQNCTIFSDLKAIKVESILKGSLEKLPYIWELEIENEHNREDQQSQKLVFQKYK